MRPVINASRMIREKKAAIRILLRLRIDATLSSLRGSEASSMAGC